MSRRYEGKTFEDLCLRTSCGCLIWLGHTHANGTGIWKGWFSATIFAWEKANGPLGPFRRLRGRTCGNAACVEPTHQKVELLRKRSVYG